MKIKRMVMCSDVFQGEHVPAKIKPGGITSPWQGLKMSEVQ
jgi:hypothetical protein